MHPKHTEGADVLQRDFRRSDRRAALGKDTPLPSLELSLDLNYLVGNCGNGYSCVYMNTLAWRSATTALPTENNPARGLRAAVWRRRHGGAAARAGAGESSILDSVTADMARLQSRLGPGDRTKVSDYVDAVREIERRIQSVESHDQSELPTLERPTGSPNASISTSG